MNQTYYEGVVLTTIDKLQKAGETCGQLKLVKRAKLGNVTIINAISRLEEKGRLKVIRGRPGQRYHYKILDAPNDFDQAALALHLQSKKNGG